jgi:regulator of sigma D
LRWDKENDNICQQLVDFLWGHHCFGVYQQVNISLIDFDRMVSER